MSGEKTLSRQMFEDFIRGTTLENGKLKVVDQKFYESANAKTEQLIKDYIAKQWMILESQDDAMADLADEVEGKEDNFDSSGLKEAFNFAEAFDDEDEEVENPDGDDAHDDLLIGDDELGIGGDDMDGEEYADGEIDGEEIAGDEIEGDELAGDEIAGDEIAGDELAGDEIEGDDGDSDFDDFDDLFGSDEGDDELPAADVDGDEEEISDIVDDEAGEEEDKSMKDESSHRKARTERYNRHFE